MGVGATGATDSALAACEAVESAVLGRPTALVIIFASPVYDLQAVARAVQVALDDDVPVIGCTTSGEIARSQAGSGRLVAIALGGSGLTAETAMGSLADGPREAGRAAAQALVGVHRAHRALVLLSEGLAGNRSEVVRGAYGVAGAGVPLVGGCAGDDLAMLQTYQLFGGEVLTGAVVGAAIGSDAPIGVGIGHGWRRTGKPFVVTESDGQRIFRLDDEPALDYYLKGVNAAPEVFNDETLCQHTMLWHPFGLPRPGGEEVRAVIGADYGDRSLFCGDVPQGTLIWMMEGDAHSVMAGTHTACDQVLASLGGAPPVGVIAFDCAARRAILGDEGIGEEIREIEQQIPGIPIGGFYTYGEIARTKGSRGVHNDTLVLLALA